MSGKEGLYPSKETLPGSPPEYQEAVVHPPVNVQPGHQPNVVVMSAPPPQVAFGPHSTRITCPSCHATTVTKITHENSSKTHLFAVILFATTCCCCIPYCIDSCKNVNHSCSECGAYLGTYNN